MVSTIDKILSLVRKTIYSGGSDGFATTAKENSAGVGQSMILRNESNENEEMIKDERVLKVTPVQKVVSL
ncbi:unnamed protein product [Gongylonema pulchrum]|uniref:Uncharacterized protein n=1 Tax=Gongylonema pulchrum TaxID=637853 RepID=A0A183F1A8_9BILA|nr:unnamed protein product [Gongylonema pulchrum]